MYHVYKIKDKVEGGRANGVGGVILSQPRGGVIVANKQKTCMYTPVWYLTDVELSACTTTKNASEAKCCTCPSCSPAIANTATRT